MQIGTVKWFDDREGLRVHHPCRGRSKDLFVHHSGIAGDGFKSLPEGAKVSYEPRRVEGTGGDQRSPSSVVETSAAVVARRPRVCEQVPAVATKGGGPCRQGREAGDGGRDHGSSLERDVPNFTLTTGTR
jgi:CspA family cold shock protein